MNPGDRQPTSRGPVSIALRIAITLRAILATVPWLVVGLCCGLPLAWLVVELIARTDVWHAAIPDSFRARLIARTFVLDAVAATLATLVAVPAAFALMHRGLRWMWVVLPLPLLLPSLVLTYGWKQLLVSRGAEPMPQSAGDVARCVIALSAWLWPAPAMLVAYAARRLDANVLMQARLDGAVGRTIARLLAGPILLGWSLAFVLALQEFAVFEPTGISVIATEVRSVFETGASLDGSWQPTRHFTAAAADASMSASATLPPQPSRTAAALAVMLPVLLLTGGLLAMLARSARSFEADAGDAAHDPAWRPPLPLAIAAALVAIATVALPIGAMLETMRTTFDPWRIVNEYQPQLQGSITLASITAIVAMLVGVAVSIRRPGRPLVALALAGFLVGGQWAAIALIHVFARPWLQFIYDSPAITVIAYLCRFTWIALVAAALTWSVNLRWLRELAATDGAGAWRTWFHVIAPTTWPLLVGSVLLVFTLSLTEVPATTLLQPADTLVPMLMTWAHALNYDPMMEASLLLAILVLTLGAVAAMLVRMSVHRTKAR